MIKYMNTLSEYVKPRELFSYYRSIQTSVVENIIDLPIGGVALRDKRIITCGSFFVDELSSQRGEAQDQWSYWPG